MSRKGFATEKFIEINGLNQSPGSGVRVGLQGTALPGGDTGEQDAASKGSLFHRTDTGHVYTKIGTANTTADWERVGNVVLDQLVWRNEKVIAGTNDTVVAGTAINPTAWTDNESGIGGSGMVVGQYILGDINGTPSLFRIDVITSNISIDLSAASQVIANNDTFIVQNYLPDTPAAQEGQAIIHFPLAAGPGVKVGDVNWNFADGIGMAAGYAASAGNVSSSDTVNSAISKLDGVNDAQDAALGLAQADTNFGTFTGDSLADSQSAKQLFQRVEVLLEQMRGVQATGITTAATVDSVPVASVKAAKWLVEAFEEATPANRQAFEVYALNNGTLVDDTVYAKLKLGSTFNLTISVDIDLGNMRLRAASTSAGVTVTARRVEVVKSVL